MVVYKVTSKTTGKVYVGQTSLTLQERKHKHEYDAQRQDRKTVKFHNALMKYGFDDFVWEVLQECQNQDELDYYESYYIEKFNCLDRDTGLNLKSGGKLGGCYSEESKHNMGLATKKKWENFECAAKMLEGLRKGTETVKELAKNYYVEQECPTCHKVFRSKPWEHKKYCCLECAKSNVEKNEKSKEFLKKATEVNEERYKQVKNERYDKIIEWSLKHQDIILNAPMNNLTYLQDLCMFLDVKDARTIAKVLDVSGKRNIALKLKDLLKIYAVQ